MTGWGARGRGRTAVAVAGVALAVLAAVVVVQALGARADLLRGRAGVDRARQVVITGDVPAAEEAFTGAAAAFSRADRTLSRPPVRWLAALPVIGGNVTTPRALARAGALVARAGGTLGARVAALPGGLDGLVPRDGRIPLEALDALAEPLEHARAEVAHADTVVAQAPSRWLMARVGRARAAFLAQTSLAVDGLDAAAVLARQLPVFLGADGPRRYFLGAQNPAEVRGTGGLVGAFGVLTADNGRITISDFQSIGMLTRAAPAALPPPSADYAARYARYGAGVNGTTINMTPDVPTAATAIETLHEAVTGQALDGAILADPYLLEALLRITGPTEVPGVGRVRAKTVVAFATTEQYAALAHEEDRKEALGQVAAEVLRSFLSGAGDPVKALAALAQAAADGRLLLHAVDPDVQEAFARADVNGAIAFPDGDFLAVVSNNAGRNKLDAYTQRRVVYDVRLQPDGSAHGHAVVALDSTAPTSGAHSAVIGPNIEGLVAGENRSILSVYCATDCELEHALRNGVPDAISTEREFDRPVFTRIVDLAAGASEQFTYRWTMPRVWQPTSAGGVYRLTVHGQPTIPPTELTVRVHPPDGMAVTTGHGIVLDGGVAKWTGTPGGDADIAVTVEAPLSTRLSRAVRDLVRQPPGDRLAVPNPPYS